MDLKNRQVGRDTENVKKALRPMRVPKSEVEIPFSSLKFKSAKAGNAELLRQVQQEYNGDFFSDEF